MYERDDASGLSRIRFGVQREPTERLDYVVSPLRRRKLDPSATHKSKLDEPLAIGVSLSNGRQKPVANAIPLTQSKLSIPAHLYVAKVILTRQMIHTENNRDHCVTSFLRPQQK